MPATSHSRLGGALSKSLPANHSTIGGGGAAAGIAAVGMPDGDGICLIAIVTPGAGTGPLWAVGGVIGAGAIMGGCIAPFRGEGIGSGATVGGIGAGGIMGRSREAPTSPPEKGLTGMDGIGGIAFGAGAGIGLPPGAAGGILFVVI
jgi:hypothetical protein